LKDYWTLTSKKTVNYISQCIGDSECDFFQMKNISIEKPRKYQLNKKENNNFTLIEENQNEINICYKYIYCGYKEIDYKHMQACLLVLNEIKKYNISSIIKFYGLSTINNAPVMIFNKAKHNLQNVYESFNISLDNKIVISLKICEGLIFLQKFGIVHDAVRCNNILVNTNDFSCTLTIHILFSH
jgi:serine/threonine protein kinase